MRDRRAGASPLPESIRGDLETQIGPIAKVAPVVGGCVSLTLKVEGANGPIFLKVDSDVPDDFFAIEAEGLRQLGESGVAITFPRVLASGASGGVGWLALEWLESSGSRGWEEHLGRELAALHRRTADSWGWHRDGYIGRLPQRNRPSASWPEFWLEERLSPQLALARSSGMLDENDDWDELRERLPDLLGTAQLDRPSLLHGDLWSGNVMALARGPALVDPACYFGHREVDLAMAALFGGFGEAFFAAYEGEWPLAEGHLDRRRVYQLYYLLVHVNLFGRGYLPATLEALGQVLHA